jgi:lysophospholipase L1-like esterase
MEQPKSRFTLKKIFHQLIYLGFMVCLSLLLCEGVVRVYSWFFFPKMMKVDPALGWYHAVNSQKQFTNEEQTIVIVQNKLGHRGPDYGPDKAAGKSRVLVIGDSFTEGSHVGEEDLFSNMIGNAYPNLEVMNAGVGGYSSVQEYLYLKQHGINLNPDLVLLLFFENDLFENCQSFYPTMGPRPFASIQNGQLVIQEKPSPAEWRKYALPLPFAETLNQYSLAYNFFNTKVYQVLRASHLNKLESEDAKKTDAYPKAEIIKMIYQQMDQLLKERGIKFAVGLIPSREHAKQGTTDVQAPLLAFCQEKGIPCLSLLQPLKEEYDKGIRPYFIHDIHWNRAGHRVAATALGPFIQEVLSLSPVTQNAAKSGGLSGTK